MRDDYPWPQERGAHRWALLLSDVLEAFVASVPVGGTLHIGLARWNNEGSINICQITPVCEAGLDHDRVRACGSMSSSQMRDDLCDGD